MRAGSARTARRRGRAGRPGWRPSREARRRRRGRARSRPRPPTQPPRRGPATSAAAPTGLRASAPAPSAPASPAPTRRAGRAPSARASECAPPHATARSRCPARNATESLRHARRWRRPSHTARRRSSPTPSETLAAEASAGGGSEAGVKRCGYLRAGGATAAQATPSVLGRNTKRPLRNSAAVAPARPAHRLAVGRRPGPLAVLATAYPAPPNDPSSPRAGPCRSSSSSRSCSRLRSSSVCSHAASRCVHSVSWSPVPASAPCSPPSAATAPLQANRAARRRAGRRRAARARAARLTRRRRPRAKTRRRARAPAQLAAPAGVAGARFDALALPRRARRAARRRAVEERRLVADGGAVRATRRVVEEQQRVLLHVATGEDPRRAERAELGDALAVAVLAVAQLAELTPSASPPASGLFDDTHHRDVVDVKTRMTAWWSVGCERHAIGCATRSEPSARWCRGAISLKRRVRLAGDHPIDDARASPAAGPPCCAARAGRGRRRRRRRAGGARRRRRPTIRAGSIRR